MGRSVSVGQYAYDVAYIDISDHGKVWDDEKNEYTEEYCEDQAQFDYECFIERLEELLNDKYKSFWSVEEWTHNEAKMILKNCFANIQVCSYNDLVSVSLCLNATNDDQEDALAKNWIERISKGFNELIKQNFGKLNKLGTFSNGCGVYKKAV